jgi:hypothetical protein
MMGGNFLMFQHTDSLGADYGKFEVQFVAPLDHYTWQTVNRYEPGLSYMFTFTYDASTGTGVIYVNGIPDTDTRIRTAGSAAYPYERYALSYGSFQQLAVFTSTLTQDQVRDIYRLSTASVNETTAARFNRIIAYTPFSASLTSPPTSPASTVLALTNDATTANSELGKVSDSEFAPLFVNKAGTITQLQQNQIRTAATSIVAQVVYGSGGLPIGTDIQLQYDGDSMRNIANVEVSGGGVLISENATSVTAFAEAEQFVATQVSTLDDAQDIANIVVGWGGQVYPKASPVQVVLSPSENWASTLGLELWQRFELVVSPPTGSAITTQMLTTRISHSVTPERWSTTLEGSARWAAVFILNRSRLGGTDLLG